MRPSVLAFLLALLVVVALPATSTAQYMFLDANGDGLPSAADVVSATGPTAVDVWLRTNTNRDGSVASCSTLDGELTLSSYEVILHASNGTVAWSGFVNRQSGMSVNLGEGSSTTDYHNGFAGGTVFPPGAYRLATITVAAASGTPSISIEAATSLSAGFLTSFGSRCSGNDFDNLLKLGSDWFDADGLEYGGIANRPPAFVQPVNMTVPEGTVQDQGLIATDADGNPVTFLLVSGPAYVSVTTVDPGAGTASGRLRVAPGFRDAGTATVQIEASDGLRTNRRALTVVVTDVNGSPSITPLGDLTLLEGDVVDRPLTASDPEGDPITFALVAGPHYVSVLSFPGLPPAGRVRVAPGFADAGEATATVSANDGFLTDQKSFHLTVTDPYPVHNQILCQPRDMLVVAGSVAEQTVHAASPDGQPMTFFKVSGPDFVTVATTSSNPADATGRVTVAPGPSVVGAFTAVVAATDGIATDPHAFAVTVGDARALPNPTSPLYDASTFTSDVGGTPQSLAAADLDADGVLDLVTANLSGGLTILRGKGDGTFDRRDDFPIGETPYSATTADLNRDGRLDLVLVDSTLDVVSVIDGIGGCQFGHRRDYATGIRPAHVKVGDWNSDHLLDLAVTDEGDNTISILMGAGDGTFGPRTAYPIGNDPCYSDAGDLNGDGYPDLATANEKSNTLSVLLGNGDGTFGGRVDYVAGDNPRSLKMGDFNADGRLDIVAANFDGSTVSILLGNGDGTLQSEVEFLTGPCPWSMAIGDLNADSRLDVVTADVCSNTVSVLLGDGSGSFAPRVSYPAGLWARFVVLGDANGDGHLDILVSCEAGSDVVAMLGDGSGTFPAGDLHRVGGSPYKAVAGDWNGDGRKDLAFSTAGSPAIGVALNREDGTLAEGPTIALPSFPDGVVTGDWNQDGKADLAVTFTHAANLFATLFGRGDGSFALGAVYPGSPGFIFTAIEPGDINGDGLTDLIISTDLENNLTVMFGENGGTFRSGPPVALDEPASGFDFGDLNGDGKLDMAVALSSLEFYAAHEIEILIGDGEGGFVSGAPVVTTPRFRLSPPALVDLDRDGALDLAFAEMNPYSISIGQGEPGANTLRIAKGRGDGTFGPLASVPGSADAGDLIPLDANGDGRTDLALVHEKGSIALFLGLGNGEVAPKIDFGAGVAFGGVTPMDLNGDGRIDLVLPDRRGGLVALLNQGTFTPVNQTPVVSAPEAVTARAGSHIEFTVTATDPDGDPIAALTADLSVVPAGGDASFAVNAEHTAGTFAWTTLPADVGSYAVRFTASGTGSGSATTRIEVGPANRAPTAEAGGPYAGGVGVPLHFDGRGSSDPDGDALTMAWEFGDGVSGVGAEPAHTYQAEGAFQVTLQVSDGFLSATDGATANISGILPAVVFTAPENRVIRLSAGRPAAYFQLEPVDGAFLLENVDLASVVLHSQGTGSVEEIHAAPAKKATARDRDRNGVPELSLGFARDDLRLLFGNVAGRTTLPVSLEGSVLTGGPRFHAEFDVEVQGASHFPSVTVAPNPMNPATVLTVQVSRRGRLRAALFDAGGRLVRLLTDQPEAPPGFHELRFDGRAQGGAVLASGIYFYRVESAEGVAEGRIVMVR